MSTYTNPLTEYSPQMETFEFPQSDFSAGPGVFTEQSEMELASRFLEVRDEQELDHFLGDLIQSAGNALGKIVGGPAGNALGGVLKGLAKSALPIAGAALGGMVGGPLGAQLGSRLASVAGPVLGLELEGLSREDGEFEAARQFVKFAGEATRNALDGNPHADPDALADGAAVEAARVYAPGWAYGAPRPCHCGRRHQHHHHHHKSHCAQCDSNQRQERQSMHDIDRTQSGPGFNGMENYPMGETPYPSGEAEYAGNQEAELTGQLMEVNSEQEFENFLEDLISQAAKTAGGYITAQTGQSLGGLLKGAARQILPVVSQAVGAPAGQEFEGDANEVDAREWEAARTFVQLAQEAATAAAMAPPGQDPATTAHSSVVDAAHKVAPDLLAPPTAPPAAPRPEHMGGHVDGHGPHRHEHGGRWVRRGNQIILYGV